ncbi:phage tail protein [Leuconostoc citreum]|uniref:phage tail protein n=1 Tax=Leuconostoc citreum TaxID=33964 RepID=UPI000BFF10D0|nr:phage tail protein [Leuconostoc citreum]
MSLGVKNIKLALVNKNGQVLTGANGIYKYTDQAATDKTGVFTADQDTSYGIASVALSGLSGATTPVYGSDEVVFTSTGKGTPSSVLTINALPNEIKQAVLGHTADGKGGFGIAGKADSNNRVAFLVESRETFDEDAPIYIGMYAGIASQAAVTMTSNNAADNRAFDAITVAGQERPGAGFGKYWFSSAKSFDSAAMMSDIFKTPATAPTAPAPAPTAPKTGQ